MIEDRTPKPVLCDSTGCKEPPTHSYMLRVHCDATDWNKEYNRLVVVRCCDEHAPKGVL